MKNYLKRIIKQCTPLICIKSMEYNTYWGGEFEKEDYINVQTFKEAQLISSEDRVHKNYHRPVLDIDFPCALVPSTTEGHFHLYIDRAMTWRKYKKLLKTLYKVGIIEKGYYQASILHKKSKVRKPGLKKEN